MIFLDIYLQWAATSDGVEEQFDLFEAANAMGEAAFASPNQLFLLTGEEFEAAARRLSRAVGEEAFVKVQEVAGRFLLTGPYPDSVHALVERAGEAGAVTIDWSNRREASRAARVSAGGWLH